MAGTLGVPRATLKRSALKGMDPAPTAVRPSGMIGKAPRKATPASLERAALAYLERFAASEASLRRVLLRKIERSARAHDTDREEGAAWVEALIERYRRSGLIDDRAYAEARTASLRRQGRSARAIAGRLAVKGVGRETIEEALAPSRSRADELAAAARLARRRRLGPCRPAAGRAEHRARDLAVLGRAGFAYDVAREVVLAESEEALDALIAATG